MVRNGSRLALLGRSRRRVREAQDDLVNDLVTVHSWLRRCLPPRQAEDASISVLTRPSAPACVASAPRVTRLQYLAVQEVLRARGVV